MRFMRFPAVLTAVLLMINGDAFGALRSGGAVVSRGEGPSDTTVATGRTATSRSNVSLSNDSQDSKSSVSGRGGRTVVTRSGDTVSGGGNRAATVSGRGTTARATTARSTMARSAVTTPVSRATTVSGNTRPVSASRVSTGRADSTKQSGLNSSRATVEAISINNRTNTTVANSSSLDESIEMLEYCKAQYANCMDEYCNILDEDMGRCSCSANINNYSKTADALKSANEALQDVAQQIQYIGLTAKDIETIFSETEAEAALSSSSDSTQLKSDLDKIKKMIVDVKSPNSSSSVLSGGLGIDLSGLLTFDISSDGFSLDSLLGTASSDISSISNQRGANLYKTAAKRCQTNVLTYCKAQGINETLITNAYDLKIDKDCLAYEKNLTDQNKNMSSTIRNAENVLRKARLLVRQNLNAYDLRGCVTALDDCMRSDFVCGSDYENCLDPTGKYIVSGELVPGSQPGSVGGTNGLYLSWKVVNPWIGSASLEDYLNEHIWSNKPSGKTSDDMAEFLQYKIGYNDGKNNIGLCIGVLNQCQDITYDTSIKGSKTNKSYIYDNAVVREWLTRTLPLIKRAQDNILDKYSQDCMSDVASCLTTNGYVEVDSGRNSIAVSACRNQMATCKNVTGSDGVGTDLIVWGNCLMNPNGDGCDSILSGCGNDSCGINTYMTGDGCCIPCDVGEYSPGGTSRSCSTCTNSIPQHAYYTGYGQGGENNCPWSCVAGYTRVGNTCIVSSCPSGYVPNSSQTECVTCESLNGSAGTGMRWIVINGACRKECSGTNMFESNGACYTKCSGGQYFDGSKCSDCPAGKECTDSNSDGVLDTATSCDVTKYSAAGSTTCSTCGLGKYVNANRSGCSSCTGKPDNAYYINIGGANSGACKWECVAGYKPGDGSLADNPTSCVMDTTQTTYTLTYNSNGGSGSMEPISCSFTTDGTATNCSVSIEENNFIAPEGKEFACWSEFRNGTCLSGLTITLTDNKTIYAQWKNAGSAQTYTIPLQAKSGSIDITEDVEFSSTAKTVSCSDGDTVDLTQTFQSSYFYENCGENWFTSDGNRIANPSTYNCSSSGPVYTTCDGIEFTLVLSDE